jgi:drug/metabolite transporter (DMT)-like permease
VADLQSSYVPRNSSLPFLWMLFGSLSFALMSTFAHLLASSCDWQLIAMARSGLAFGFTLILALLTGSKLVLWRPATLWLRSIAGSVSLVSAFYALTHLPVSDVLTLTNMFPIWVAVLSWPLLKERPTYHVWLAVISGVAGVVLIQRPHIAAGNFAAALALFSSFTTAIAMMGLHRLKGVDARAVVVHFSGVSFLFGVGAFFILPRGEFQVEEWDGKATALLLGVGITATIGQLFLTKAFAAGPPAKVSVAGLTQIVFAVILDWLILDRSFGLLTLLGIGLVVVPTAWVLIQREELRMVPSRETDQVDEDGAEVEVPVL